MIPLIPVLFEPLYLPKPWGGRRLELLDRTLPAGAQIGESWELAEVPSHISRVRGGPLAGRTLAELRAAWGRGLFGAALSPGDAAPPDVCFPLLIKYLDATDWLSIQVHPSSPAAGATGGAIKHEVWYVLHAEPGARLLAGTRPGVGPADLARAAGTAALPDLLETWPARPGDCFYIPAGTPHALGTGLLVVEVQTPVDVTYRLYDWDRADAAGRQRDLHLDEALAAVRCDIPRATLRPVSQSVASDLGSGPGGCPVSALRIAQCTGFRIDRLRLAATSTLALRAGTLRVWIVTQGRGRIASEHEACAFTRGDVILLSAGLHGATVAVEADCELLDVTS